jgi:hypothetical protein
MHEREKSDPAIRAKKPTNTRRRRHPSPMLRSRWSKGRGPRGTRASKARTGHRVGSACHRRARTESRKAEEGEEAHRAPAPH